MWSPPSNLANAPALSWRRRKNGYVAYWICRDDLVKRGYTLKSARLWPPPFDYDGGPPTAADLTAIGLECERLQGQMLDWAHGEADGKGVYDKTMRGLIECYRRDPDSPYQTIRYSSRRSYVVKLRIIEKAVGDKKLEVITGRDFKRWYEGFRAPAKPGGPERISLAHSLMTHVRMLMSFGVFLELDAHCARLKTILGEMEFQGAASRNAEITSAQARAVIDEANRQGHHSIALAQAIGFELTMRPKDIIGEWVPVEEPGLSAVTWHGMKWFAGVTWEEVDASLILRHRLSKSLRGRAAHAPPDGQLRGKELVFSLSEYPMVVAELARIPIERRHGPLVVCEKTGRPWGADLFRMAWRKIATAAGVPVSVRYMDSRAGGLTESTDATGDIEAARHQAGHSDTKTTQRYSRGTLRKTTALAIARVAYRDGKKGGGE